MCLAAVGALAAPAGSAWAADETTLLVRFRAGTAPAEVASTLAEAGAERDSRLAGLPVQLASVPAGEAGDALAELRASPDVLYAEQDGLVRIAGTFTGDPLLEQNLWPYAVTRLTSAWDLVTGDPGVTIAILDTGVGAHDDLQGVSAGWDFFNNDADPSDDHGHGTAVAGIVAAAAGNGQGIAGVCWSCSVLPVKVLGADGYGTWSGLAAGITWAADQGADVINLSLGAPAGSATVQSAVEYARARGVIVIAAAGNAGSTAPYYPADYPGVIAVAASDQADTLYGFSNRGSWVEVAAPGCVTTTRYGGGWRDFCGTSAAAPFVAGLVGLARSLAPAADAAQTEAAVLGTAAPVAGVAAGRIDARAALELLGAPPAVAPENLTRPRVRGRARVGARLRVDLGVWTGESLGFRYRWERCSRAGRRCVAVGSRSTYRVRKADLGRTLRVLVTAQSGAGEAKARSRATRRVR